LNDDVERAYLNPALGALVIHSFVVEYELKAAHGPDWLLIFAAVPLVFHRPTREKLPSTPRTHMSSWVNESGVRLFRYPDRMAAYADFAREALLWALQHDLVALDSGRLHSKKPAPWSRKLLADYRSAARRVAWLFFNVTSTTTVYHLLGVRRFAHAD
jgi:hypothetical protein